MVLIVDWGLALDCNRAPHPSSESFVLPCSDTWGEL